MTIDISDDALRDLFPGVDDDVLVVAVSPDLAPYVSVDDRKRETVRLSWNGPDSRAELVATLHDRAERGESVTALWIGSSDFEHYSTADLSQARIAALTFFSTEPTERSLDEAFAMVRSSDYAGQELVEQRFLTLMDTGERLVLADHAYDTEATVEHTRCEHWFSLNGPLRYGQQTVLPTGEISILASASGEFVAGDAIPIDGEIVLHGETLTHRGDATVTRAQTADAYSAMSPLRDHAAVCSVEGGVIASVRTAPGADPAGARALDRLFDRDARYTKIHELGFGTNTASRPLRHANWFGDERFPGVHFGLGLGGHLDFHFDVVCPGTDVYSVTGAVRTDVFRAVGLRP